MGEARPDSGRRRAAIAALILLATLAAYLPVFRAGFVWDDDGHVTPPALRSVAGLARIWTEPAAAQQYYPLLHTAFWVEHRLFGDAPLPYHLVNVLMHAGVAYLAWRVLAKLEVPGALLAAFVFALHPVQVETVAWVSEQKNTLSALLALGALCAWLAFDTPGTRARAMWLLSFVLFVGALLSKTVTATLPAAILVIAWWREGRVDVRRTLLPLIPFFVVGAGLGLTTAWLEKHVGGAAAALSSGERLLLAGRAPWFYLGKLAWPSNLCFVYSRFALDVSDWRDWAFPIATIALLAALWIARRRVGRGPLAAALLFGGTLFPVLGFVDVLPFEFSYVADHFQYLACLAPIALGAAIASRARVPAVLACALLGALAFLHARDFRDAETLWRATVARNPDAYLAWNNLAELLNREGRFEEARVAAGNGVRARPGDASAHVNLGVALRSLGRAQEAVVELGRAIEIDPRNAAARVNLGNALLDLGRTAEAIAALREALRMEPDLAVAHESLGNALLAGKHWNEAVAEYERALELDPDSARAWYDLGVARGQRNEPDLAETAYLRALAIDADYVEARFNLAIVYLRGGRRVEARVSLEEVVRRDARGAIGAKAGELLRAYPAEH